MITPLDIISFLLGAILGTTIVGVIAIHRVLLEIRTELRLQNRKSPLNEEIIRLKQRLNEAEAKIHDLEAHHL